MVDESFTSSKTSISNILLNDVRYIVPPYQRDYSWTAEQLENFWNDILEVKNSKSHFFGSMIFQKSDDNKELIVIDGQQRLATITILLAVIRDILYKEGDQKASILINQNYILKAFEDNKEFRKLSLNLSNDHYFYYCIQKELSDSQRQSFKDYEKTLSKTGKSNKLLKSSYEYFDAQIVNYIKDFDKIGKTLFLTDLSKTIREKFIFINIIVGSEEEAYLIFETINDRGLDLSVSDLFKNYLIRKSNEEKRKEIVESWNDITKKLDEKLRPFLLHYWLYKIEDTTERKLFSRLQLKIEKNQTTVQNFINDLRREAHIYSQFLNPELKFWKDEEILEILDDYNTLGITQSLPVLMSGKALYSLDPKKFKELLKLMISFTFRYTTICNFANNDLDKKFNLITKKMRNGEITEIEQIKGVLKEIDPTEKQFYDSFKNKDIKHNARAKYILKKIDLALKEYSEKPDYRSLTLEHIFPQNPNKDWDDKLKEKGSKIVKNPSEYLNRIGNLTLLDIKMNKGASNLYFTEKKNTHYSRSTLNLNLDLNNFDSWDEVEISSRQESLASIAKEIWKIK